MIQEIAKMSLKEAETFLLHEEQKLAAKEISTEDCFCPNHALEQYLYEYYTKKREYHLLEIPMHVCFEKLAQKYRAAGEKEAALQILTHAQSYNPVDIELYMARIRISYELNRLTEMHELTLQMYPYLYTARDMAQFYDFLGWYYMGIYDTECAKALYAYSNFCYPNEQARVDLQFLEKAAGGTAYAKKSDRAGLRAELQKRGIFVGAKKETLQLVYLVGREAVLAGNTEYGKKLLAIVQNTNEGK